MSNLVTMDVFQRALPKSVRGNLTQDMVNNINDIIQNEDIADNFRDNILGHTAIMKEGKFKMQSYINAVKYISYKLMNSSNIEAFSKTFPDRYQELLNAGADDRKISGYVSGYNSSVLVNKILEQTMIPVHILNAELYQKAINAQAYLMINASSDKVKSDAANSLLTHLKPPETNKIELDVSIKEDRHIADLKATIAELSAAQKKQITGGVLSAEQVAHSQLQVIDVEHEEL